MIFRRRKRFSDVVRRQLDLFEREHGGLIRECDVAERAYDAAAREEAEELYGDYLDLVATAAELLVEIRDTYGSTLDERNLLRYEREFNRAAAKRFPRLAIELE